MLSTVTLALALIAASPRAIDPVAPSYPSAGDGRVVDVTVGVVVDAQGHVREASVREVQPRDAPEVFVSAALDHVRTLRFDTTEATRFDHVVTFTPADATANDRAASPAAMGAPDEESANDRPAPSDRNAGSEKAPPAVASEPSDVREVRVRTARRARRDVITGSDFEFQPGHFADVPRGTAEKMLTLAPGLVLYNPGGEGHPSAFFLRGFDAGEGQDIEFLLDGVPLNDPSNSHGHGLADTLFIIPELVSRLRVTEGPFDPRQGDFAVAGTAEYELGLERRGVIARGEYGSFNTGRALLMWGPERMSEGTFVAADFKSGDGFGINRAHRSARLMAGLQHDLPQHVSLQTVAFGYATRYDSAGVLRRDDFDARRVPGCDQGRDAQFFCTYDRNQGGQLARVGGFVRVSRDHRRRRFDQNLFVIQREQAIRENFTGFVTDIRPAGLPQRGDGVEQAYNAMTIGARGSWGLDWDWAFRRQRFDVGWGLRYDDATTSQRRLTFGTGTPYRTDFDSDVRVVDLSAWAGPSFRPLDRLDIAAGVRADFFAFGVSDRGPLRFDRNGDPLSRQDVNAFGVAVQPRVSSVVHLLSWPRAGGRWDDHEGTRRVAPGYGDFDWLSAYGIGTRSSDATALSDGERAPFARVQSADTGLRTRWHGIADLLDLETRAVAFYTHVDRDLVFDQTAGRNVLAGESNRFGVLGMLRVGVREWAELQGSVTWSEAYLPPASAGAFEWTAGPRLPYIPRVSARGDASVFHDAWARHEKLHWAIAMGVTHVAPRPLPLDVFGSPYTVMDVAAHLQWRFVEVGVQIQNVTNRRYHQFELFYASDFDGPSSRPSMLPALHYAAGPPLTAIGTLTLHWERGAKAKRREERRAREQGR